MKAEERKREKYLPTLLVQQIRLQWYKDCRGGNAAAQRNQYPKAMRLPKDFFSYHKLKLGQETVLRPVLSQLQELRERELRSNRKISDIDNEIARISEQNLVLVRLKSKGYVDSALYLSQMDEIDRKLRELRKLRRRLLEAAGEDRQIHDTERMMEYLEDGPEWLDEVPAELFGELIERIIIISPERLKFRLLNGMELAENIERTVR